MKRKQIRNRSNKFLFNITVLVGIFTMIGILTSSNFAKQTITTSEIVVQNQDTLWNIASDVCYGSDTLNIQNVILDIKEINQLKSSDIYAGQVLNIPVYQ